MAIFSCPILEDPGAAEKLTSESRFLYETLISLSSVGRQRNLATNPTMTKKAAQHKAAITPLTAFP